MRICLGLIVYYWDLQEQALLLQHGLLGWVEEARQLGLEHFWYCSFDTRGPHVLAVFTIPLTSRYSLECLLQESVSTFLAQHPSCVVISTEALAQRHKECRGITMSSVDALPGLAENNTFRIFEHPSEGFPWSLTAGFRKRELLLGMISSASLWSIRHAGGLRINAALQWLRTTEHSAALSATPPAEYWRYHINTLLFGLDALLQRRPEPLAGWLEHALGENNLTLFEDLWKAALPIDLGTQGLAKAILEEEHLPLTQRFHVLRELDHFALLQLGQMVRFQIPMILFAWRQALGSPVS